MTNLDDVRFKAFEDAIEAIKGEHLHEPQNAEDDAYDVGLNDAINAVRRLQREIS